MAIPKTTPINSLATLRTTGLLALEKHSPCPLLIAGEMIIANDRYVMNETDTSLYAVTMTLIIKTLHKLDFGGYKCISKNSIGDADQTVRLYRE